MPDFFATLAGKNNDASNEADDLSLDENITHEEPEEKPAPSAEPPVPVESNENEEPTAIFTATNNSAKKKKKKSSGNEPEGQLTIDVYQTKDDIIVKSTIAGVDVDDLDISITEDTITIRGERDQSDEVAEEDYYYRELYWGSFSRSIILPLEVDPDKATASIKDGVLTIRVPKSSRSKERKVSVKKN